MIVTEGERDGEIDIVIMTGREWCSGSEKLIVTKWGNTARVTDRNDVTLRD